MSRHERRRTTRQDVGGTGLRDVQLQPSRRFYTANGNDGPMRTARALQRAFQTGTELYTDVLDRRNAAGAEQAQVDFATGNKDIDQKTKGYLDAWDMLEAERDVNDIKKELPEILRGANWEELSEQEVQGLIDSYMEENFRGYDPNSAYSQALAKGVLPINQELLQVHKDMQLQNIQLAQRQDILGNVQSRFEASAQLDENGEPIAGTEQFDYDYLAEQTRIFFDGSDKRTTYIETIFDFAIKNGRPDILENAPERFGNGDPTGIRADQDAYRAALNAATQQQARNIKAAQDAEAAKNSSEVQSLQILAVKAVQAGQDPSVYLDRIEQMAFDGRAEFSDVTSVTNFSRAERNDREDQSPVYPMVNDLWEGIFSGEAGSQAVMQAYDAGYLGYGKTATTLLTQMLGKVETLSEEQKSVLSQPEVTMYRSEIKSLYNPSTEGLVGGMDNNRFHVQNLAVADFNERIMEGQNPTEAYNAVRTKFNDVIDSFPDINTEPDIAIKSSKQLVGTYIINKTNVDAVLRGEANFDALTSGVPQAHVDDLLAEMLDNGDITEADIDALIP